MDFSYTPDEEAFRLRARQWLEANAPRDIPDRGFSLPTDPASIQTLRDWQRRLFEAGFLGLSWPVEYGGQGKTIVYSAIFSEEMARARAPSALNLIGLSMAAPTILEHGTDEQQRRFVPKILSCEEIWCQGFSEPGSGSDLAALPEPRRACGRRVRRQRREGLDLARPNRRLVHAAGAHRARQAQASRAQLPAGRHAQPRRHGAAAAPDDRRGGIQPALFRRRARAAQKPARAAGRRMGRRADHADERAGDAVALDRRAFRQHLRGLEAASRSARSRRRDAAQPAASSARRWRSFISTSNR